MPRFRDEMPPLMPLRMKPSPMPPPPPPPRQKDDFRDTPAEFPAPPPNRDAADASSLLRRRSSRFEPGCQRRRCLHAFAMLMSLMAPSRQMNHVRRRLFSCRLRWCWFRYAIRRCRHAAPRRRRHFAMPPIVPRYADCHASSSPLRRRHEPFFLFCAPMAAMLSLSRLRAR